MQEQKIETKIDITDVGTSADKKLAFTKTFNVEYVDPDTDKKVIGTFTVKRASLGDLSQFGIVKARLNGGQNVDRGIDWMNEMIAFCQVTLTDAPAWWDPIEMYDQTILVAVYGHVRSFQDSFRNRRVGQQRGPAANGSGAPAGDRVAPAVVEQEVQPPA